jgi:uncharacterized protein YbjT (DUF2867 family)
MATTTTKSASQSSDKSETILVTGATGTVGSEVIKQVSRATRDINIKAAVHSAENVKKVVKSDTEEPIQIDYYKPETLREALKMLINFSYSHHFSLIW